MYQKRVLRDLCASINYGYTASASRDSVGPKFLRITDIAQSDLEWEGVPFCPIEDKYFGKYRLLSGDIVIARTGATAGWAKYIAEPPPAVFASYLVRIRLDSATDARYVGHVVESKEYKEFVLQHAGGAAQPNANAQVLTSFELPVPPLPIQRRIAAILTAYNELIENNRKRIAILDKLARRLYREWFVQFRYPGHHSASLVESRMGQIPQGWEVHRFGEVITLNYGKALKSEERKTGSVPVYGSSGVVGYHSESLEPGPGLIVGRKGNVGSLHWSDGPFYPIDTVYYAASSIFPLRYLVHSMAGMNFLNNDAAVPGLSRQQAYGLDVVVPPQSVLLAFCEFEKSWGQLSAILSRQNNVLRRTRDLLLPRLISGTLSVEAITAAEAAAP